MRINGNRVLGHMGDVLAEKINGVWESKEQHVLDFVKSQEEKPKAKKKTTTKKVEEKLEIVRARNEDGQFIADDPETPEVNEAWVVKTVKKAMKK